MPVLRAVWVAYHAASGNDGQFLKANRQSFVLAVQSISRLWDRPLAGGCRRGKSTGRGVAPGRRAPRGEGALAARVSRQLTPTVKLPAVELNNGSANVTVCAPFFLSFNP